METYFIRHRNSVDENVKMHKKLLTEHRIFIHYPWDKTTKRHKRFESRSKNPEDYEGRGAKTALRKLNELAENGGYVCAQFPEHPPKPSIWMVGFVPVKSKIELFKGRWKKEELERWGLNHHSGIAVAKTLRLFKARLLEPADYALLQTFQPQGGTIVRWPKAGDLVEALVLRRKLKPGFDLLSGEHQELLCEEFLRNRLALKFGLPQLDCLLCDVGRTMKDLDIYGLATDGKKIFGQVTHNTIKQADRKLDALKKFRTANRSYAILFCDCESLVHRDGVIVFPIRKVYSVFTRTKTGKRWLNSIFSS